MSAAVLDLNLPHLRLVSLKIAPPIQSGQRTHALPGYFVVRGYLALNGRMMIRWNPSAALGQASHHMRLPETDGALADQLYGADTDHPMKLEDHGALLEQSDRRYAYLMVEVEDSTPTHSI